MKANLKTVPCSVCGKDITRSEWQFKRVKNPVCDAKCQAELFRNRIEKECDWCGKLLQLPPNKIKRNKHFFCDRKCAAQWQVGKTGNAYTGTKPVFCDYCGDLVYKYPSELKASKHHFCNPKCMGKWISENRVGENHPDYRGKVKVLCSYCKKEIEKYPFEVEQSKNLFCNARCRKMFFRGENASNWRGGISYHPYPDGWNEMLKEDIRTRDLRTCQLCFKEEKDLNRKLHVHHLDGDKFHICKENLVSLCTSCHTRLERTGSFLLTMIGGLSNVEYARNI